MTKKQLIVLIYLPDNCFPRDAGHGWYWVEADDPLNAIHSASSRDEKVITISHFPSMVLRDKRKTLASHLEIYRKRVKGNSSINFRTRPKILEWVALH